MNSKHLALLILILTFIDLSVQNEEVTQSNSDLVSQGRTMVHHAIKRFMIILPAIFFKLGIAFTLLIVIALAALNNGFIGFLLLVVGMSSVLARLQESRRAPFVSALPPYQVLARNDDDRKIIYSDVATDSSTYPSNYYYSKYKV